MDFVQNLFVQHPASVMALLIALIEGIIALVMWRRETALRRDGVAVTGTVTGWGRSMGRVHVSVRHPWQGGERTAKMPATVASKVGDQLELLVDPRTGRMMRKGSKQARLMGLLAVAMLALGLAFLAI